MKKHLAGIKGDIQPCKAATPEIKKQFRDLLESTMKKKEEKKQQEDELRAEVNISGDQEDDVVVVEPLTNRQQRGPIDKYSVAGLSVIGKEQQTIKDSLSKKHRDNVSDYLAHWAYKCNISFNALNDPTFLAFTEALGQYGRGYKLPTRYECRESLLQIHAVKTKENLEVHREWWKKMGCTVMADGWTDRRGRSLMNLCVNSELGTVFLRTINGSADTHNA